MLKIVSKLLSVLLFCNAHVTGNHQTNFLQGEWRGREGNMRHAEVSERHNFAKILSQNVGHNPHLVIGLVKYPLCMVCRALLGFLFLIACPYLLKTLECQIAYVQIYECKWIDIAIEQSNKLTSKMPCANKKLTD